MHVRYLVSKPRKGRLAYYWQPTAKLIAAGFAPERLPNNRTEAIARAETLNATIDAFYASGHTTQVHGPRPWTLAALDDLSCKTITRSAR